jgi:imipenem/basic amino acid-specific outer membrane pore
MYRIIMISLSAAVVLNGAEIDTAFKEGKVSGQIRAAYINQDNALDADTYATSIGGILKYETAAWNDIKLGIAGYTSQKIDFATGNNESANNDFFGNNAKSYIYLGEAYIDYSTDDFVLRVGRQQIDTPFAQTDDIRMLPNTFEAAFATYKVADEVTLLGGYLKRFAGYDSGNDISKFKKLDGVDSNGALVLGVVNESVENLAVQGWYYGINNLTNILYTDATYSVSLNESMGLEFAGQFGHFNETKNSGVEGNVYGIGVSFNVDMLTVGAASNVVSNNNGKTIVNGFGGGPYYTSMEEMTINGLEDARAYRLNAEIDMTKAGIEGLKLATLYGDFRGKTQGLNAKVTEFDIVAGYTLNDNICADMSYAMIDDKNKNNNTATDGGYDRFLIRINYSF